MGSFLIHGFDLGFGPKSLGLGPSWASSQLRLHGFWATIYISFIIIIIMIIIIMIIIIIINFVHFLEGLWQLCLICLLHREGKKVL